MVLLISKSSMQAVFLCVDRYCDLVQRRVLLVSSLVSWDWLADINLSTGAKMRQSSLYTRIRCSLDESVCDLRIDNKRYLFQHRDMVLMHII